MPFLFNEFKATIQIKGPLRRHRMSGFRRVVGPLWVELRPSMIGLLVADSVEKLAWRSGAGAAEKFDLIERPLLNATRSGDGL